jgi:hypothetical protein
MFPITPVELHEGYVIGEQRIITAVSGTYRWTGDTAPQVLCFDVTGRTKEIRPQIVRAGADSWDVTVQIEDWENIAIIK